MSARRKILTRYEVKAYRPTGAVVRAVKADFRDIEHTIGELRREIRDTGWTPEIRVWQYDPERGTRDVTDWYPRA